MAKAKGKPQKASKRERTAATNGSPSAARRFFRFLFLRPVRWVLLIIIFLALLFSFSSSVVSGFSAAWGALFGTFGVGLILIALALVLLGMIVARRGVPETLQRWSQGLGSIASALALRRWNLWLGGIAICLAVFGLLAFFRLGGTLGMAVIGAPDFIGAFRLIAVVIVAIVFIAPRGCWRLLCDLRHAVARAYRRYPLHAYVGHALVWPFHAYRRRRPHRVIIPQARPSEELVAESVQTAPTNVSTQPPRAVEPEPPPPKAPTPTPVIDTKIEAVEPSQGRWPLPSISALERTPEVEPVQVDTERGTRLIEEALASYGVEGKVVQVNVGPTVTQYGIEPGWVRKYKEIKEKDKDGNIKVRLEEVSKTRVKVERISSLANDLALALAAPSIKIEAPVPGKSMVGIEVPNSVAGVVTLRSIIESAAFQKLKSKARLPLALGKGVAGEAVVADLAKMPHLLIAGQTGAGKSICIKSVISSFLLHANPDELRLLLVDLKRVELIDFNALPHLVSPVIVESERAMGTLKWLLREMERRYDKLAGMGARDIDSYNRNPRVSERLPYLVLVIDELAEMMSAVPDEAERSICRLAQLARATGIHMIVATQRPSVDVITGLIKANFPARLSFAVASQVDSRTILDVAGAEKLLGRGDMLFLPPDAPKPKRLQGSFVSEADIERLVSFWISHCPRDARVPKLMDEEPKATTSSDEGVPEDPIFEKARRLAQEHTRISTSFLQRRLGIGYPRAARLMDLLEEQGVVAAGEPGKSRQVLKGKEE
ncbi:MAG: DNA translocase FtsK [Chloroflexota bacterium]|nr:DNA translocase FtsK [Chloroflexota bacterium]